MDAPVDQQIGEEIRANDLLEAYRAGIFPMAEREDDPDIFWVDPPMRGIIPLDNFHVPESLKKRLKKRPYRVTINAAFDDVIAGCAAPTSHKAREQTWINAQIRGWFCELHRAGHAHSVECWNPDGTLAGGLYGLAINGAFFGESMFSREVDASKIALVHLVARLRRRGFSLLDCQFVNAHLTQFGCVEIPRGAYHSLLAGAVSASGVSFAGVSLTASASDSCAASSPVLVSAEESSLSDSDMAGLFGSRQSSTVTS